MGDLTTQPAELNIVTVPPGAQVLIDGKSYGPSPVRATLAPGNHTYTVKPPGGAPFDRTVTLQRGVIVTKRLSFGATVTSPHPAGPAVDAKEVGAKRAMGVFHLARGEYDEAIALFQEGLNLDPTNGELRLNLGMAIKACQMDNSILNEGLKCGARNPVVTLIPSGDFERWNGPVMKGQMLPDNSIEGGLKPMGGLPVPPMKDAPPNAVVVFIITIDADGNVTPGRRISDDYGLGQQVMAAAKRWKFQPPTVRGEPVSTAIQVKVTF
jgi:TonB family protein